MSSLLLLYVQLMSWIHVLSAKFFRCSFRYYKIIEADHIFFILNRERAGAQFDLMYDGIFQRCRKHMFRSRTPALCSESSQLLPQNFQTTQVGGQRTNKNSIYKLYTFIYNVFFLRLSSSINQIIFQSHIKPGLISDTFFFFFLYKCLS